MYRYLFFNKFKCLSSSTLLKKTFRHSCFPVKFCKIVQNNLFTDKKTFEGMKYCLFSEAAVRRSSSIQMSLKTLRNLQKKNVPEPNTAAGLRSATLLNKWLRYRCFRVNLCKFLRTSSHNCCQILLDFFCVYLSNRYPVNFISFHTNITKQL